MKLISLTLLLTCVTTLYAQVYTYVDKNGNTIYTDNPPEQQETRKLDIQLTQPVQQAQQEQQENQQEQTAANETKTVRLSPDTMAQPTSNDAINTMPASINDSINQETTSYQHIDIIKPANEETIRNSGGQLTIEVKSEPTLASNHLYRFLIDGNVIAETTSKTYNVSNLERGEHKLIVEIINASDKQTITRSQERVFFIKQTTLAEKKRINPCLIREYGIRPECPLKDKPKPQPRNLLLKITDLTGVTKPKEE
ncbi:DUF4124 domain-containing protein [Entomomonas moraniae]|uniref:DUF4124 domain-containing protein n=1 Tax=Entomomonas moraniae TaxID=2213226 RepID=A0A3Q9JMZ4_9GAMM|nr:DUF4124 domain-containing protein [Entomomonas moraniae]AZS52117.1 DUF4124 domain-containing protein [Entomomonas moraniae]